MTKKEVIKEFKRWIKSGQPNVWIKELNTENDEWFKMPLPCWNSFKNLYYIVNDRHAELRKLYFDNPNIKFQIKPKHFKEWTDVKCEDDLWNTNFDYRIKPLEWYKDPNMVGKPVWVRDEDEEEWTLDIFYNIDENDKYKFAYRFDGWVYAKPVKPQDCYQGE